MTPTRAIYAARALRDFGDGFVAVLLPVYLVAIGLGPAQVGLVATLALLGSAATTLLIGYLGAGLDHRRLLLLASVLMCATGIAFAASTTFAFVLLVAAVGTINPSAGSVSIFMPLEHTVLARSVADTERTAMFARYGLIGSAAAAVGALAAGSVGVLGTLGLGRIDALRAMFLLYAVLGIVGALLYRQIPAVAASGASKTASALGPSKRIVYKLGALFSIDSFAGGFVVQSLMALWLFTKFGVSLEAAGLFFFCTSVLGALSLPVAAWLAKRIGLVNTMVYSHIPANLFLVAAALVPRLDVAIALLLARAALSQMDVPTRSSYVMAVVTPAERPAAASVTAVPRSLAAALAPALAGAMMEAGHLALPLVLCGVIKTAYDLALLWTFRHVRPPEEQAA